VVDLLTELIRKTVDALWFFFKLQRTGRVALQTGDEIIATE
jgi:hypothetical protein